MLDIEQIVIQWICKWLLNKTGWIFNRANIFDCVLCFWHDATYVFIILIIFLLSSKYSLYILQFSIRQTTWGYVGENTCCNVNDYQHFLEWSLSSMHEHSKHESLQLNNWTVGLYIVQLFSWSDSFLLCSWIVMVYMYIYTATWMSAHVKCDCSNWNMWLSSHTRSLILFDMNSSKLLSTLLACYSRSGVLVLCS